MANELATLILNEDVRNRASLAAETTQFLEREVKRLKIWARGQTDAYIEFVAPPRDKGVKYLAGACPACC